MTSKEKWESLPDISYEDRTTLETGEDGVVRFYYEHFHENSGYLYRWIKSRVNGDSELTEEIHQATMVKALENHKGLRNADRCKTWLCRIASNLIADRFREQSHTSTTSWEELCEDDDGECGDMASENSDLTLQEVVRDLDNRLLMKCLNELTEAQRYVICMHHFHDHTFQEIADKMEESPNTVSSWYYRGCKRLKTLLLREGGLDEDE